MIAATLRSTGTVESHPIIVTDVPVPVPRANEVLIRVAACGLCRTDLHVIEGELPQKRSPLIPGHQIVGRIVGVGEGVSDFSTGERVGVAWLHRTCGACQYCRSGRENLCEAALFTGYSVDGGYAEYVTADKSFVYRMPASFSDVDAAPLLCAGIIGFRALRICAMERGANLGLYGFGAAAHIAIQVARHLGINVYAFTRNDVHQKLAQELGATWTGGSAETPPTTLDAAIIFAPAGELVVSALRSVQRGGTVACAGIHMSPIPSFDYDLLYHERVIRSVANNTRADGEDFLELAARIPIRTEIEEFPLSEINTALNRLKHKAIRGAGVVRI